MMPQKGELYYLQGVILSELGQNKRALQAWEAAVKKGLDSDRQARAYYNQGVTLSDFGDTDLAIQRYRKALESDSTFWRAHLNLIRLLRYRGEYQQGIHHASRVIQLTSGSTKYTGYLRRSSFYFLRNEYETSIKDINQVLRQEPDHFGAFLFRAILYAELGEYQSGIEDANQAIGVKPKDPRGYTIKGLVLLRQGRYQEALSAVQKAFARDDGEGVGGDAWLIRARVHLQQGNLTQALKDCNRAIKELPDRPHWYWHKGDAHYTKARILKQLNRDQEAQKAIDKAIEIDPGDTTFRVFKRALSTEA